MNHRVKTLGFALLTIAVAALAVWQLPASRSATLRVNAAVQDNATPATFISQFISQSLSDFSHAASFTELQNGDWLAVWFSGSREGADDVQITQARYDFRTQQWQPTKTLLTREQLIAGQQLFSGKLGNPVIATAPDGKLWLFVVAATYFGWGSSTINLMLSDDNGVSWSPAKRLHLSPLFNLSSLVRNAPLFYDDGSVGLPMYRESAGKFPQWLRLNQYGEVIDQVRVNDGRHSLQPAIVAFDAQQMTMLMRSADGKTKRVLAAQSNDAGLSWSAEMTMPIANPNSGLSAVQYDDDEMLVALNDVEKGRHQLSLYRVDRQLKNWHKLSTIESSALPDGQQRAPYEISLPLLQQALARNQADNPVLDSAAYLANLARDNERLCDGKKGCEFYYDYPYLYRDHRDRFHLLYSWNKSFIKHVVFNRAHVEKISEEQTR